MLQYKLDKESLNILGNELRNKPSELLSFARKYVLDLGGNTGKLVTSLKTKSNKVLSIDINRDILVGANKKPLPEIEPIQGNILYLPFKDNTFDVAFARAIFHHVPGNLELAFEEVERVLAVNGLLLIEEPSYHNPFAYIVRKAFPTTSHEVEEQTLKVSHLKRVVYKYLYVKEIKYYWLLSYTIPHVIARLPKRIKSVARILLKGLVKFDTFLLKFNFFKPFCGYVMILCQKKTR